MNKANGERSMGQIFDSSPSGWFLTLLGFLEYTLSLLLQQEEFLGPQASSSLPLGALVYMEK